MPRRSLKRKNSPDKQQMLLNLLAELKPLAKTSGTLPGLNESLPLFTDLIQQLARLDDNSRANKAVVNDCMVQVRRFLRGLLQGAHKRKEEISNCMTDRLLGTSAEIPTQQIENIVQNGMNICCIAETMGIPVKNTMLEVNLCAASLRQYYAFSEAYQRYRDGKEEDILNLLSLIVTPATSILLPEEGSRRGTSLFYSGHEKWKLASFMGGGSIDDVTRKNKALSQAPDFFSNFEMSAKSNGESPLVADKPSEVFWQRACEKGAPDTDDIIDLIHALLSEFSSKYQEQWETKTSEPTYTAKLGKLFKKIIEIANIILPPSINLVWEGEKRTECGMYPDVLVSMCYNATINGTKKSLKVPIYCAEYKRVSSMMSMGMKATGDAFEKMENDIAPFLADHEQYDGSSNINWPDQESRHSGCREGLKNCGKAIRQGFIPPLVEEHCQTALNQENPTRAFNNAGELENLPERFPKLASVIAYGIGDGTGHSIGLVSRKLSDFKGDWPNLKYGTLESDAEVEHEGSHQDEVTDDGISLLYKEFKKTQTCSENGEKPSLSFSDYIHMDDDEHFPLKILKGLVNVAAMNVVVMFYLLGCHPDDNVEDKHTTADKSVEEDESVAEDETCDSFESSKLFDAEEVDEMEEILRFIKRLTEALGKKFRKDYGDIIPEPEKEDIGYSSGSHGSATGSSIDSHRSATSSSIDSHHSATSSSTGSRGPSFTSDSSSDYSRSPDSHDDGAQHGQNEVRNRSHEKDSGHLYRFFFSSKAQFQRRFIAMLHAINHGRWAHVENQLMLLPTDLQDLPAQEYSVGGRRTFVLSNREGRSVYHVIDIRTDTVLSIYNELEAYARFKKHPKKVVAPQLIDFGTFTYQCLGITMYKFYLHVTHIPGVGGNDPELDVSSQIMDKTEKTLAETFCIEYPLLDPSQLKYFDGRAYAIDFSNVRFVDQNNTMTYEELSRELIRAVYNPIESLRWFAHSSTPGPGSASTIACPSAESADDLEGPLMELELNKLL